MREARNVGIWLSYLLQVQCSMQCLGAGSQETSWLTPPRLSSSCVRCLTRKTEAAAAFFDPACAVPGDTRQRLHTISSDSGSNDGEEAETERGTLSQARP